MYIDFGAEGASFAASNPLITGGVAAALGFVVLRGMIQVP